MNTPRTIFLRDMLFSLAMGAASFLVSIAIRSGLYDDGIINSYSVSSAVIGTLTALAIRRTTGVKSKQG
ncbi:hypothetical protein C8250_042840 [Streptomyces sp. So13.3]|uniref:hypothetical protein n=1 Tax=Streptomyces sp. So13.3 TaxID=2136173 RepID=UPI001106B261|nr:hypothetical protein [Streptomyces sp. So13.3]QNA77610.1 hypothetical protein C8250_042840 [Streptomyces sp. So13.3]